VIRSVVRRLSQLETWFAANESKGPGPCEILFERRQRRLKAAGLPCEERPRCFPFDRGNFVLDAGVLRAARARRIAKAGQTQ
jgi:hypothetical protein